MLPRVASHCCLRPRPRRGARRSRIATPARTNRHSCCARRPPWRSPRFPPSRLMRHLPGCSEGTRAVARRAGVAQALTPAVRRASPKPPVAPSRLCRVSHPHSRRSQPPSAGDWLTVATGRFPPSRLVEVAAEGTVALWKPGELRLPCCAAAAVEPIRQDPKPQAPGSGVRGRGPRPVRPQTGSRPALKREGCSRCPCSGIG